jgi:outer membrane protein assembly factor BamB
MPWDGLRRRHPKALIARTIFAALLLLGAGCNAGARVGEGDRAGRAVVRASTVIAPRVANASPAPFVATDVTDVLTAHNDAARTGWNSNETRLTVANVNPRSFGKLFDVPVDGQVYAQPLIASGVTLPGIGRRNLLFIATEHDSVYAVDADSGRLYWKHTFEACCGVSAVPAPELVGCNEVAPLIGISATPVIDRRTGTLYVVATTVERRGNVADFHATLYALSLATGADRLAPANITAAVELSTRGAFAPGTSLRHSLRRYIKGGWLTFDAQTQFSRPGLLLANGSVYAAFSSHCDAEDAHGWIFAYDAATLSKRGAFTTIGDWHDVNGGGIWQSGFGLTGDGAGNVFFTTGNGPFNADDGGRDYGDSLLKLTPDLGRVVDYFTPSTQSELEQNDADFGGGGFVVLPDGAGPYPHLGVVSSKVRAILLVNRDHLGGYHRNGSDDVLQTIGSTHDNTRWCIGTCGGPAYYAGPRGEFVFNAWTQDSLRAFRLKRDAPTPRLVEVAHSPNVFPGLGGTTPSVSSNGMRAGSAIVWATTRPAKNIIATQPIQLIAFDAADVTHILYTGDTTLWRNVHGIQFLTPTIANGKVYVGGDHDVSVFGLLKR